MDSSGNPVETNAGQGSGIKRTGCASVPSGNTQKCPSTATEQYHSYSFTVSYTATSCTASGTQCASNGRCLSKSRRTYSDHLNYPGNTCYIGDTDCYCATYTTDHCSYRCTYTHKETSSTPAKYHSSVSTYGSLGSSFDGATLTFTCKANGTCGSTGSSDGSTTVTVGNANRSDDTDGCSAGTNYSTYTASTNQYNTNITWTCAGSGGGADDTTTDKPYSCVAGVICEGDTQVTVDSDCGDEEHVCSAYCSQGQCVECTQNSHCTGAGQVCINNTCVINTSCTSQSQCQGASHCTACGNNGQQFYECTGSGTCESCSWDSWACHPTQNRPYRACKASGVTKKYETKNCPSGQSCSNGQCS